MAHSDLRLSSEQKLALLKRTPEFSPLPDEAVAPLAEAMTLAEYPTPHRGGSRLGRLRRALAEDPWIAAPTRPWSERSLSLVVDGHIRLQQWSGHRSWQRALGRGTFFGEEAVAAYVGRRGPAGLRLAAAAVGTASALELPPDRFAEVLGADPSAPLLAAVLRGFDATLVAPKVVEALQRAHDLDLVRLDDLYALVEGAQVQHLRAGDVLEHVRPGQVPAAFYVVLEGQVLRVDPAAEGAPRDVGVPLPEAELIGLHSMIRRKPIDRSYVAAAPSTVVAIRGEHFDNLLYAKPDLLRSVRRGAEVDPLAADELGQRGNTDVIFVYGDERGEHPVGPLTDLLAGALASHLYDRTAVLHLWPPIDGDVPASTPVDVPHQDPRYPGTTPVTHHWLEVPAGAEGVAAAAATLERLLAQRTDDHRPAYDVVLIDVAVLAGSDKGLAQMTDLLVLGDIDKVIFVTQDPDRGLPMALLTHKAPVLTVGLLGPSRDPHPVGRLLHEVGTSGRDLRGAAAAVTRFAAAHSRRRVERLVHRDSRSPPWPSRTVRVRIEPELAQLVAGRAPAGRATPLSWRDCSARTVASLNRWARGVTGRRVGLALGGGGAYGYVHASLIRLLQQPEYNVPVDMISGSSFGAVVGAYYTGGDTTLELLPEHWWLMTAATSVGVLSTRGMASAIHFDLGTQDLNDLEVAFLPVATDADTGAEHAVRRGTIGGGVRASGSLPPFAPTLEGARRFLDGGLVANVPVQVLHDEGAGMIIASNPIPEPNARTPKPPLRLPVIGRLLRASHPIDRVMDGLRSTLILMRAAGASQERFADVVYAAETQDTTMFSFSDGKMIMRSAEEDPERRLQTAAEDAAARWRKMLRNPPARIRLDAHGRAIVTPPGLRFLVRGQRSFLTRTAISILRDVAELLRDEPRIERVGVSVAACRPRAADDDDARRRATSIVEQLARLGIAPDRIELVDDDGPLLQVRAWATKSEAPATSS